MEETLIMRKEKGKGKEEKDEMNINLKNIFTTMKICKMALKESMKG